MDKITKLSQAIELGSTFRPQCKYRFYDCYTKSSCVLGAAYEALGYDLDVDQPFSLYLDIYKTLAKRFNLTEMQLLELADRNNKGESRESIAADLKAKGL